MQTPHPHPLSPKRGEGSQIPKCANVLEEGRRQNMNKPIGVSEYQITANLPEQLRSSLPSIEQIEAELGGFDDD